VITTIASYLAFTLSAESYMFCTTKRIALAGPPSVKRRIIHFLDRFHRLQIIFLSLLEQKFLPTPSRALVFFERYLLQQLELLDTVFRRPHRDPTFTAAQSWSNLSLRAMPNKIKPNHEETQ
jgi:hypothetical protein